MSILKDAYFLELVSIQKLNFLLVDWESKLESLNMEVYGINLYELRTEKKEFDGAFFLVPNL